MPCFTVLITRNVTESTIVTVAADDAAVAETAALDKLQESEDAIWTVDDGSWNNSDAYVTSVDLADD